MRFLIITHASHKQVNGRLFSYAPYVREMNLWLQHVNRVEVLAPFKCDKKSAIDLEYKHSDIHINKVPALNFQTSKNVLVSAFSVPLILFKLIYACLRADHIHLRCPGNIGLLGCFVQVFFPNKIKTAKYAGNWDSNSAQPSSYRLQKQILSSTKWTKNMTVLVYGKWPKQSKNIKSFYTASFHNSEREPWREKDYSKYLKFIFVGSLVEGKRPLLAIKIVEALNKKGKKLTLEIYGDGILIEDLKHYCVKNNLRQFVNFQGNQPKSVIKDALQTSHFSILPSKSEGWPKAITEAMFYGVIPITTKISCVPWMLDNGKRGILIEPDVEAATNEIINTIETKDLNSISKEAHTWSQTFTLDRFNEDIRKLLGK